MYTFQETAVALRSEEEVVAEAHGCIGSRLNRFATPSDAAKFLIPCVRLCILRPLKHARNSCSQNSRNTNEEMQF